ncbi:MAG: ribonuclease HIII [Ignavibacteriaceae bacterium]|nr:ribonuclease HIII [Ignavibacteriaceae bacterium]
MSTPLYKEIRNKYYNADSPVTSVSGTSGKQSKEDEPLTYIGTDESGKGDYFGPLIIAGTGVDSSTAEALRKIGVRDSKQLNDSDISRLYPLILGICKDNYNIITINPPKYNELYAKIKNLNKLLAWGHAKTIENILTKKNYPQAISDKFGDESYIINSLQKLGKQINLHQVTKAERYTAVAAASILARHTFNSWFINSKSKYGFELRKGASKEVEKLAGIIIKERGVDYLSSIAKVHFKTTVSANNLFNQ